MRDKIIKITIFAVAILDCILALTFAFTFNEEKKDNYSQVQLIQAQNPTMLDDFATATTESLPELVAKYQASNKNLSDSLKGVQLQKDILYTYLQDLKGLDENNFEQYKADFPSRAESLFAKCDKKQAYVDGFNAVKTFKDLEVYLRQIENEYASLKQSYLEGCNYLKAANSLVSRADMINASASVNKKEADLAEMQKDLNSFKSSAKLQILFMVIGYCLGGLTLFLMLFFALAKIVKEFKTSYKILVVLALLALVVFIGYAVGSPVLTPSAIKMGLSVSGFKMVNAAAFTLYVCILSALLAIFGMAIVNAIKNRK
ncbi:MAG: hypothetical protein IJQ94_04785 [Bacteroidales bacterium]|nr:hypothetical protein [Bacteroidales bacterium]